MIYRNRSEAGKHLATRLKKYANRDDLLVLALPRGGVPVGFEVAKELHVTLDIFLVRKLGVPGHEELAMGAISTGGVRVLNEDVVDYLQIPGDVIDAIACASTPEPFLGVGQWYRDFSQTTDDEVRELLESAEGIHTTEAEDRELTNA